MQENSLYDKKSLKLFTKRNPDWDELAKDCVAFANSFGGNIHIGIEDDDDMPPIGQTIPDDLPGKILKIIQGRTLNVGITATIRTSDNSFQYIDIQIIRNASSIACTTKGKYYYRMDDVCKPLLPDELTRLMNDKQAFVWELQQYLKIPQNNADTTKQNTFLDDIRKSDRVSEFVKNKNNDEILEHYFFTAEGKLTNLGILWIGKREHRARLLYSPVIQFIKYDENNTKVNKLLWDDYSKNPKELIQEVWEQITDFRESIEIPDGIFRKHISNYDEVVVRELVANALVHRPYTTRGDIFINLYTTKLEIHNPGLLPIGVTPDNILHKSIQRNPHLAKVFYDLNLMEKEGSGYDKIYETLLSAGKQLPIVNEGSDRVAVSVNKTIINKNIINFIDKVNKEFQISSKELIALGLIAQHNSLSKFELSRLICLDENLVTKEWLGRLIDFNLVISKGKTKGVQYSIRNNLLQKFDFKGLTNLKRIQNYRLKELIREDLKKFPNSSRNEIHTRIGKEIPERRIRSILKEMLDEGIIQKIGKNRWTKYLLTEK
jgi:ATP-dependent DNA helicase RecG